MIHKKKCVCGNLLNVEDVYQQGRADANREIQWKVADFNLQLKNSEMRGRQDAIDEAHKFCGKNDDTEYCVECALSMFKDNEFVGCYLDKLKEQNK